MSTYLRRNTGKVQPQPQAVAVPGSPVLFIGLDVHTESIAVCLAPGDSVEVRRYGLI